MDNLDLNRIINDYNSYVTYEDNLLKELPFICDDFALNLKKKRINDFLIEIDNGMIFSHIEVSSLKDVFIKLKHFQVLTIEELAACLTFLNSLDNQISSLKEAKTYEAKEIFLDLIPLSFISEKLNKSITAELTISDEASNELKSLRRKKTNLENSLSKNLKSCKNKYKDYLIDDNTTIKNGYMALPVISSYKNKVEGIEIANSKSGNTAYLVPQEVLKIYNEISIIEEKIQEEIYRILKELSNDLSQNIDKLNNNYSLCLLIDQIVSIIEYGKSYDGILAEDGEYINLSGFGHPLIAQDKLVRNDINLGNEGIKSLLISGPNAGGKTILLKSIALVVLFNQAGFFVPCNNYASLPIFDKIHFLCGDNQSVLDNLSTFSSHIINLKQIIKDISDKSIIIIDEIGQGTSPLEGASIGVSLFKYAERKGSYIIISSHYDELKDYVLKTPSINSGMMLFDESKIEPTYRYIKNRIGHSFGLKIAEKLGLDKTIISDAKEFIESRSDNINIDIETLQEKMFEYEEKNKELESLKLQLEKEIEKKKQAQKDLARFKADLKEKEDNIIEEKVTQRIEELDQIWKKNKPITNFAQMSKVKQELKNFVSPQDSYKEKLSIDSSNFNIGDRVRIKTSGQIGIIESLSGKKTVVVANGITFKVLVDELEPFYNNAPKKVKPRRNSSLDNMILNKKVHSLEINLIGLTYEEARSKLLKYLDDCLVNKSHQARIVHGVGTSTLQKMVWNELKKSDYISDFRFGGEGEGGVGCTVVYFK